jgi:hypothetical protein
MAKTVIDFDDYEPPTYEEYDGDDPRPGWYTFELSRVGWSDEDTLRWIFLCTDEPYTGWPGMVFANFGTTKWKNQEVARAIQGGRESKLQVDFDNEKEVAALVKKAKRVRGKVERRRNPETGDERIVLRKVRPLVEEAGGTTRRAAAADVEPDPEPPVESEAAENDEPYTEEELNEMELSDLKEILKDELEMDVPAKGRRESEEAYADKLVGLILEAQGEDNGDDFGEGEEGFAEPEPEPEPEPAPARRRRGAAAAKPETPPAKAAPARRRRA